MQDEGPINPLTSQPRNESSARGTASDESDSRLCELNANRPKEMGADAKVPNLREEVPPDMGRLPVSTSGVAASNPAPQFGQPILGASATPQTELPFTSNVSRTGQQTSATVPVQIREQRSRSLLEAASSGVAAEARSNAVSRRPLSFPPSYKSGEHGEF